MNLFDIRTVITVNACVYLLCSFFIAYLWLQNRKKYKGLLLLFFQFTSQFIGLCLISARGEIPNWISMGASNTIISLGTLLGLLGLDLFINNKVNTKRILVNFTALLLFIIIHFYFIFEHDCLNCRNLNSMFILLFFCLQSAWLLLYKKEGIKASYTRMTGIVFLIYGIVFLIRIFIILTLKPSNNNFLESGLIETIIHIIFLLLFISLTISIVLMLNKRLLNETITLNHELQKSIAEQLVAEQKIKAQYSLLIALINSPDDLIIFSLDKHYCYTSFNKKHAIEMKKVWNADIKEGMNLLDLMTIPELKNAAKNSFDKAFTGTSFVEIQHQPTYNFYYEFNWSPVFQNNEITGATVFIKNITENKKQEQNLIALNEALHGAAAAWQSTFDSSPDAISIIDTSHRIIKSNQAMKDLTNGKNGDLINAYCFERIHGACSPIEDCPLEKALISKKRETFEMKQNNMYFEVIVDPILNKNNEIVNLNHIIRDVTSRKGFEEKLKKSEQHFRFITEKISDVVWLMDLSGKSLFVSPSIEHFTGFTVDEYLAQSISDRFTPESAIAAATALREEVMKYAQAVELLQDYKKVFELDYKCKNGNIKTGEFLITPYFDEHQKLVGIHGVTRNVTERKLTENLLKESELKFRNLVENTNDIIWETNKNSEFVYVSPRIEAILGYTQEELLGHTPFEFMPPDEAEKIIKISDEIIATKIPYDDLINVNLHKDGHLVIFETCGVPILNSKNEFLGYRGIDRDITERKKAEEQIRESEEQFRAVSEYSFNAICIIDETGKIIWANESMVQMGRYTLEQIYSVDSFIALLAPESIDFVVSNFMKFVANQDYKHHYEFSFIRADGKKRLCEKHMSHFTNKYGKKNLVISMMDITEERLHLKQIKKLNIDLTRKNQELEQLIYLTSHDLRSPLVNIQGFSDELAGSCKQLVELLSEYFKNQANMEAINNCTMKDIPEALFYIDQSCVKMNVLIEGLLKVSRLGRLEVHVQPLTMQKFIAEVLTYYEYKIKENGIKVEVADLPNCMADSKLFNQVISNLIDNAIKFKRDNEKLHITISGYRENGSSVYCIEDNGKGISSQHLKNIFVIFHKEDQQSHGEGLGLTIAAKIIEKHNGKIWVESKVNKGSKFFIKLEAFDDV